MINGKIPKLQGDKDDKIPAKKDTVRSIGRIKEFPDEYAEKICTRLSIYCILNF